MEKGTYSDPRCCTCEPDDWRESLREFWLNTDPAIICRMLDGEFAILIIGPSDSDVARGVWRFGFQVHGEQDIRWCLPEQLERHGNGLIQRA